MENDWDRQEENKKRDKLLYEQINLYQCATLTTKLKPYNTKKKNHYKHASGRSVDEANSHCLVQYQVQSSDISNGRYHQFIYFFFCCSGRTLSGVVLMLFSFPFLYLFLSLVHFLLLLSFFIIWFIVYCGCFDETEKKNYTIFHEYKKRFRIIR